MKFMSRYILILILLVFSMVSRAQDTSKAYRNTVAGSYNFWFYRPDEDESDGVHRPLLIFLHGASLCGTDLNKVKKYGPMEALKRGRAIDCYVLAPQNPGGSWNPQKIMKLIEWAEANFHIDSDRIYCYGMSLGGYGTLDMCATYPDRIAAGMAMCGGATVKDLSGLSRIPMWIVHGTADTAVPVSASDRVVEAIKKTGDESRLIYTRMPGINHGRLARIFYCYQTYDWMFSHSLKDEDRPINRDFEITPQLLQNAYHDLGRNANFASYD
jgi:predicted peptidase